MGIMNIGKIIDLNTFSAEDAKIRSKNIVTEYSENQLNEVLRLIVQVSGEGGNSASFFKQILPNVILELEKRGFKVSEDKGARLTTWRYEINW